MKGSTAKLTQATRMHPLVAGAAASVIVLSAVGVGAFTGIIPNALSQKTGDAAATAPAVPGSAAKASRCPICGVVESVRTVELRGQASGIGAVTGGLTGAVLGNTLGRGRGNTAMTIIGAAGGALAGNEIEKNVNKHYAYRVTIRMDDGSVRAISQSTPPPFAVGDKVRLVDGNLTRA